MNHLINISLSFLQKNIIISDANLKILKYGLNILYSTFLGILGVLNYNLRFWFAKLNSWEPILDKYKCYQLRF